METLVITSYADVRTGGCHLIMQVKEKKEKRKGISRKTIRRPKTPAWHGCLYSTSRARYCAL
jgi:hypothetical protein